jgi:hypothetical protein
LADSGDVGDGVEGDIGGGARARFWAPMWREE